MGCAIVFLAGCASEVEEVEEVDRASQAIVYGEDDRRDVFDVEAAELRELVRSSMVALIVEQNLYRPRAGEVRVIGPTLDAAYGLCEGERFGRQHVAADCTGVLIDDNLVVTAGHCFESDADCDRYAYVFDYYYREPGQMETLSASDVYGCRRMVTRQLSTENAATQIDYAVIELDRTPLDRVPVPIRSERLELGTPMVTIGTTSGLPMKVDTGAAVLATREGIDDFFTLDADTFEGSSGSGIFDTSGKLAGILVRGGVDYVEDADLGCLRARVLADADEDVSDERPLPGEQATYVSRAVRGICEAGFPSQALCDTHGDCGDGLCMGGETRFSCPQDCQPCLGGGCGAKQLRGVRAAATPDAGAGEPGGGPSPGASGGGCAIGDEAGSAWTGGWLLAGLIWLARRRAAVVRPAFNRRRL